MQKYTPGTVNVDLGPISEDLMWVCVGLDRDGSFKRNEGV